MRFAMTLGTANRVSSVVTFGLMMVPSIVVPLVAGPSLAIALGSTVARLFLVGVVLIPFGIVGLALIWGPSGLELTHDDVRVLRRVGAPVSVPLSNIVDQAAPFVSGRAGTGLYVRARAIRRGYVTMAPAPAMAPAQVASNTTVFVPPPQQVVIVAPPPPVVTVVDP